MPIDQRTRVYTRDGERAGVVEIVSIDDAGKVTVHRVSGLALASLACRAVEAMRRGLIA